MPTVVAQVRAGKLRALAVTSKQRSPALPDVPSVGDFVPGYDASGYFGFGAPRATPAEIISRLNKEIQAAVVDPPVKEKLVMLGIEPLQMTPAEYGKLIADETEKWAKVIKTAGIKAE
jgi:tripartite-type tricarboxylate transporter receptor subunit TctC